MKKKEERKIKKEKPKILPFVRHNLELTKTSPSSLHFPSQKGINSEIQIFQTFVFPPKNPLKHIYVNTLKTKRKRRRKT